jgi:hypothetical protein
VFIDIGCIFFNFEVETKKLKIKKKIKKKDSLHPLETKEAPQEYDMHFVTQRYPG